MQWIQQVRDKYQAWRVKKAFQVLDKYGILYFTLPNTSTQTVVTMLVKQVEEKFKGESGQFKRDQVLRASMNSLPDVSEREIAMAIEVACSAS